LCCQIPLWGHLGFAQNNRAFRIAHLGELVFCSIA
jgi:hypothetical protein